MGNINTVKNDGITFNFSTDVKPKTQRFIEDAIFDVQKKSGQKEFFNGLKLTVYSNWKESKQFSNFSDTKQGFTAYPIFMTRKAIFLQTNELQGTDGNRKIVPADQAQIKENTLHEIGHLFDFHFANPDEEVVQKLKDTMSKESEPTEEENAVFDDLLAEYKKNNGLSDSEEFQQAWKNDVERAFKGYFSFENKAKTEKLGYFSPTASYDGDDKGKDITLQDGIDDRELELADRAREEVFAQLFAYALGADGKNHNKELILETYKESYKVVQNFIEKLLYDKNK